jgi:hypothetical protein
MRSLLKVVPAILPILFLGACARQDATPAADLPHATVVMRDGGTITGNVAASSPNEITINVDGGGQKVVAMKDVRRVDYGAPAASTTPAGAPASAAAPPASRPPDLQPTHEEHHHPEPAEIQSRTLVVPAGTEVPVRTEEAIDSATAVEGQTFAAEVAGNVKDAEGAVVLPRGANASIVIRSASKGGKFHGAADLVMDLQSVSVGGRRYRLDTVDLAQKGRDNVGVNKRTGEIVGGGAAIGAIIGAIAGGGKGAGLGAGAGAGAGAVTQVLTKGGSIKVPPESILTFKLEQALRVVEAK